MRRTLGSILRVMAAVALGLGVLLPLVSAASGLLHAGPALWLAPADPHVPTCECPRCERLDDLAGTNWAGAFLISIGSMMLGTLALGAAMAFEPRPPRSGSCARCGYDLRGLGGAGCPECGSGRA